MYIGLFFCAQTELPGAGGWVRGRERRSQLRGGAGGRVARHQPRYVPLSLATPAGPSLFVKTTMKRKKIEVVSTE